MNSESNGRDDWGDDIYEVSIYSGDFKWDRQGGDEIDQNEEMAQIHTRIRALYDSGAPLFTEKAIQDLDKQLKSLVDRGQEVHIRGLDGTTVNFENATGRTFPAGRTGLERVLTAPSIKYVLFQRLGSRSDFNRRLAYCNLQVEYWARTRNTLSKQIITPPLQPYEEVKVYFGEVRNTWNGSQSCTRLKSILDSTLPQCSKILGFALGEISREVLEVWHRSPAFQHALLLTLRDILSLYNPEQNEVVSYTQDPAYSEVDKLLLKSYGVTVVDDPEGFLQVDDSSAVISCGPNAPIRQIVSDLAQPTLMIWDKVCECTPQMSETDPVSPRLKRMIHDLYDSFEFPGESIYFGDLAIYIRRPSSQTFLV